MTKSLLTLAFATIASSAALASPEIPVRNNHSVPEGFAAVNAGQSIKTHSATRADGDANSLDFTLAYDPYNALRLNYDNQGMPLPAKTTIYQAFEFSKELTKRFAGKTITSVNVCTGTTTDNRGNNLNKNTLTDIEVFLADDLDQTPFTTQAGTLGSDAFTYYSIKLDKPYVIQEGHPFIIGYSCVPSSTYQYYIAVDYIPTDVPDGGYYGYKKPTAEKAVWDNFASEVGNVCIGCTIEGEGLPVNGAKIYTVIAPNYVEPGTASTFQLYLAGDAANPVNSIEVQYTTGNGTPSTQTINMPSPVGFNQLVGGDIEVTCTEEGITVPYEFKITKVNGADNSSSQNSYSGAMMCFSKEKGFKKIHTFEEGTGTWCGWCPAGIVMLEYLRENYADDAVAAALHAGVQTWADEMQVSSTTPVLNLFPGFPMIYVNREEQISPVVNAQYTSGAQIRKYTDDIMKQLSAIPAPAQFSTLEAVSNPDNTVSIKTGTTFALSAANDNRFRISLYVTEDGMGPYKQNNYFSGASQDIDGWEKGGDTVETVYNDVARLLSGGLYGLANSLPTAIEAGKEYEYSTTLSTELVSGKEFSVIALINDNETGAILNARKISLEKDLSGVDEALADSTQAAVKGGKGVISISCAYGEANVWTLAGQKAASAKGGDIEVPAGLYIVNVDGDTVKVLVK